MNKQQLVNEYSGITKEMENIRDQIMSLKNIADTKIKAAKTNNEKASIFVEFKNNVDKINKDKITKKKYKNLKKRKLELETEISTIENRIHETTANDKQLHNNLQLQHTQQSQQSQQISSSQSGTSFILNNKPFHTSETSFATNALSLPISELQTTQYSLPTTEILKTTQSMSCCTSASTNTNCSNSVSPQSAEVIENINVLMTKYKKFISKSTHKSKSNSHKSKKSTHKEQRKKLSKIMRNLKMEIDM